MIIVFRILDTVRQDFNRHATWKLSVYDVVVLSVSESIFLDVDDLLRFRVGEIAVGRNNRRVQFTPDRCGQHLKPFQAQSTRPDLVRDLPRCHCRSLVRLTVLSPREISTSAGDAAAQEGLATGSVVVDIAQYHGISVPEFEFLPDQPSDMVTTSESKDTLADEKAREVWKDSSLLLRTDST